MILTSPARGVDDGAPRGRNDWQEGPVAGLDDFGEAVEHAVPVDDDFGARPKTRLGSVGGYRGRSSRISPRAGSWSGGAA